MSTYRNHSIAYSHGTDSRGDFFVPVIDGECTMGEYRRTPADALQHAAEIIDFRLSRCPHCGGHMVQDEYHDTVCGKTAPTHDRNSWLIGCPSRAEGFGVLSIKDELC